MLSCFIAVGIFSLIFWVTDIACSKRKQAAYSHAELLLFYGVTRILPLFMLQTRNTGNLLCLSTEWVIMGLLCFYISRRRGAETQRKAIAFYLFQPGIACFILSGNRKGMYLTMCVLTVLCLLDRFLRKKTVSRYSFLPEYLFGGAGLFLWNIATQILLQHAKDVNNTENIPVAYIFSVCLMGMAAVMALLRICTGENRGADSGEECEDGKGWEKQTEKFSKKDFLFLALLTAVFGFALFYRLGSLHTPETFETIKVGEVGENEIVLQFDGEQTLSEIEIYLGYKGNRQISVSSYEEETGTWQILQSKYLVQSAFCWNSIQLDSTVSTLGLVLMEGDAQIMEIVCRNERGEQVYPANMTDHPSLFDEQYLFVNPATYYDGTMFDEVYHGRTAYEFLNGLPIYENTHPPLGKSIISIGIALFGANPFGWRFMCALFGTLMIPLMYLFARKMFGRADLAAFAGILLGTLFMNTTLSRIATIDILIAFFVLLMFFFMYEYVQAMQENKSMGQQRVFLLCSGLSMGLAVSTKWTGVYGAAGIAVVFFYFLLTHIGGRKGIRRHKAFLVKTGLWCVLCFIVIPFGIYTLSYIPFVKAYPEKSLLRHMIENAQLMFGYHSTCVFDHPYSSEWYRWLIGSKPLADSRTYFADGTVSVVMTFLNPLSAIGGLLALLHQFYLAKSRHSHRALFLIIAYAAMLLPWLLVHRTVFIYQYFISALFLVLMIVHSVAGSRHRTRNMVIISVISIALYLMYYPVLTGQKVSVDFVNRMLEMFSDWNIA